MLALSLGVTGCSSGDITSPTDVVFPATNVSFHASVAPYLAVGCNTTNCHDGNTPGADPYTSYALIISTPNFAVAHDTTSTFVQVMDGETQHLWGPIVANDNIRNGIRQWIKEGAQDN